MWGGCADTWGCSVHRGISLNTLGVFSRPGDDLNTPEGAQYIGGGGEGGDIKSAPGVHHDECGDMSTPEESHDKCGR